MTDPDEITLALEECLALVQGHSGLRAEFTASRAEFFARPGAARTPGSELRHLEWFCLERPSPALGAVPVLAFAGEDASAWPVVSSDLKATLMGSIAGAFEVTSESGGHGAWVRDLFTLFEHPLAGSPFTERLKVGDLLVGRLFPAAEGSFAPSPAVSLYRAARLLSAVRADLAAMRTARRGVLRIQQLELEHLFHGQEQASVSSEQPTEFRGRARAALTALGLDETQTGRLLAKVRLAAENRSGNDLTEFLNHLAFETRVDLELARQILVDLWQQECRAPGKSGIVDEARMALEAFDRGRGQGKDLEVLFSELERDLGLEGEATSEEAEDSGEAPDFPGVVGAVVEEFLWERERELGPERAQRFICLRLLGEYAQDIGVLEDLGWRRLLDFSARWLLDETQLGPREVEAVLDALQEFCVWIQEQHLLPLQREFEEILRAIKPSMPRLAGARGPGSGRPIDLGKVTSIEGSLALVEIGSKGPVSLRLSEVQSAHLRPGDLVRLTADRAGIGGAYPVEVHSLLRNGSTP